MSQRYILLNKPFDVLCQFTDTSGERQTLADYVEVPRVYPVGRLDRDSEGLVMLTNDGWMQHRLSDPRYDHPKTYWAQVEGIPDEAALQQLRDGIQIWDDFKSRPAQARMLPSDPDVWPRNPPIRYRAEIPTSWIELILTEGRNRQVRRMTAAVGFPTLRLIRMKIGPFDLGSLKPGQWRELTRAEIQTLPREAPATRPRPRQRRMKP